MLAVIVRGIDEKCSDRKSTVSKSIREKLPPAESSFGRSIWEVRPGTGLVSDGKPDTAAAVMTQEYPVNIAGKKSGTAVKPPLYEAVFYCLKGKSTARRIVLKEGMGDETARIFARTICGHKGKGSSDPFVAGGLAVPELSSPAQPS